MGDGPYLPVRLPYDVVFEYWLHNCTMTITPPAGHRTIIVAPGHYQVIKDIA